MSNVFNFAIILLLIISLLVDKVASAIDLVEEKPDEKLLAVTTRRGLTFVKEDHLAQFGIDHVACRILPDSNGINCNPYTGDTFCSELRPVLCAKIDNTPRPPYFIDRNSRAGNAGLLPAYFCAGWNRGQIPTTVSVAGLQFVNRAAVDKFCENSLDTGWAVATFYDGIHIPGMNGSTYAGSSWTENADRQQYGGWNYYSYGNVRNDTRFWVPIRDQPATCWTQ